MRNKKITISHFINLIVVAQSDGKLDQHEKKFLFEKAIEYNIETDQLSQLIDRAEKLSFKTPKTKDGKERELAEIVSISLIDGIMHPNERALCLKFALKLGFNETNLEMAINLSKRR